MPPFSCTLGNWGFLLDPPRTLQLLETEKLCLSPMVLLEMDYLREIGRIHFGSQKILKDLVKDLDVQVSSQGWLET